MLTLQSSKNILFHRLKFGLVLRFIVREFSPYRYKHFPSLLLLANLLLNKKKTR